MPGITIHVPGAGQSTGLVTQYVAELTSGQRIIVKSPLSQSITVATLEANGYLVDCISKL